MATKQGTKHKVAPAVQAETTSNIWNLIILMGVVAVITFFSFAPVTKNGFINQDDNIYVFENTHLGKPLPEAITYFFEPHYFSGNYVPVTMITYALAHHAAGNEPGFYHGLSLFIHLCNVLMVFWFVYLLGRKKPYVAVIVSLFFGIHPMHVESVAWAAELKDVLYTLFFIAGLIVYYKYIEWKNEQAAQKENAIPQLLFLVFILFTLSVLSKPAAVVFPVVLLLLDFYAGRKFDKRVWIEKIPLFIVAVVFGAIAIKAQRADELINDHYPFVQRLFFAAYALIAYIGKLFLPVNLSTFYPYPPTTGGHLPYIFYIAPAVVAAMFYGVYRSLKYTRVVAFGFLFFFVNTLLVLQLLSVGNAIMADRYTYVPYIGLLFIIAMGFDKFYSATAQKLNVAKQAAIVVLVVGAIVCSFLTYARCGVWENEEKIAADVLEKFPDDAIALNNKAYILVMQGKQNEAIPLFEKAIQVKPEYVKASINLINAYATSNDYERALKITEAALVHAPRDYYLLNAKGYIFFKQNKYPEAMKLFNEAIGLEPDKADGYAHLAECYFVLKDYENQVKTIDRALKYLPDNYGLLNIKGYALFVMGKYSEAAGYFETALKINPDYTTASANLADCRRAMNMPTNGSK